MSSPTPYIRSFRIQSLFFSRLGSTNDEARKLLEQGAIGHGSVVRAGFQEKGRGQMGQSWQGNEGENIYLSLVLEMALPASKQFLLNMAVSLACLESIQKYLPGALIKWPNDLIHNRRKLGGILIENNLTGNMLVSSIVGIGINVNQKDFGTLTSAGSLCLAGGKELDTDLFYDELCANLEKQLNRLPEEGRIRKDYFANLLFYNQVTTFENQGRLIRGKVTGVDEWGRLKVEEGNATHVFGIKEIRWLEI